MGHGHSLVFALAGGEFALLGIGGEFGGFGGLVFVESRLLRVQKNSLKENLFGVFDPNRVILSQNAGILANDLGIS